MQNHRTIYFLHRIIYVILLFLMTLAGNSVLQAQDCNQVIEHADKLVDRGQIKTAIDSLKNCRDVFKELKELTKQVKATEKIAFIYIEKKENEKAKNTVKELFDLNREYKTDRKYPELFPELVKQERLRRGKLSGKKWYWIVGGSIIVSGSIVSVILLNGGSKDLEDLPNPPRLP